MKDLIRDDDRNNIDIIDFKQEKIDEIKDKNQLIEEEVVNNIINDIQIEYPQDNQNLSFPNTPPEILKEKRTIGSIIKLLRLSMRRMRKYHKN